MSHNNRLCRHPPFPPPLRAVRMHGCTGARAHAGCSTAAEAGQDRAARTAEQRQAQAGARGRHPVPFTRPPTHASRSPILPPSHQTKRRTNELFFQTPCILREESAESVGDAESDGGVSGVASAVRVFRARRGVSHTSHSADTVRAGTGSGGGEHDNAAREGALRSGARGELQALRCERARDLPAMSGCEEQEMTTRTVNKRS